jgi:hypothetical protein
MFLPPSPPLPSSKCPSFLPSGRHPPRPEQLSKWKYVYLFILSYLFCYFAISSRCGISSWGVNLRKVWLVCFKGGFGSVNGCAV